DGQWVAIYSNRDGPYQIWLMRSEGTDLHRIFEGSSSDPTWSPDGTMLSVSVDMGSRWSGSQLLRRETATSSDRANWVATGDTIPDFSARGWSPDGRLLLGVHGYPRRFVVYDIVAGEQLEASSPPNRGSRDESWFPDSERIVYWDQASQHYVAWNLRSGELTPLVGVDRVRGDAMVSADGRTLYVMEQSVDGEIWMLTLDGGADVE
ncbi:MAG: hypothetical protein OEV00_14270, partial [Acidobacteriota bacterium]|nr:hypothetical protein [Acidobacteriota bacterium]